jgi:membrane protease YdiL (CAAX protease family)
MKQVLKYLGIFLLWNLIAGAFLIFTPPIVALPAALITSGIFLWGYVLRAPPGTDPARRWATLRLRPLNPETRRWTVIAVPVLLVLSWSLGDAYTRVIPVPAEDLNPFADMLGTPGGRLTIAVFAIAVAPILEEFIFRGLIQRHLERRYGATRGILAAAGLFALVHLLPWIFPLHFFLGIAFGFTVWATRSIWAGVALHAANNAAAMIGFAGTGEQPQPTGTLWELGVTQDVWVSLVVLILALFAAFWTAGKLKEAGRSPVPLRAVG